MNISNFDEISIIGGNIAGLSFAFNCLKRNMPFTVYEKQIWDKPCGGGFGDGFMNFLKENGININALSIKYTTVADRNIKIEHIPYHMYSSKRKHIQEKMIKRMPDNYLKMKEITKKNISELSKFVVVATGVNGITRYLLQKRFTNMSKFRSFYCNEDRFKNWQNDETLYYFIPEILGYAWIFPTIEGDFNIGIGGLNPTNLNFHFKKFKSWLKRTMGVKILKSDSFRYSNLIGWGVPMWDIKGKKTVHQINRDKKQIYIGIGDAIEIAQVYSAGGIENTLASSEFLSKSIDIKKTNLNFDLNEYKININANLPLPSNNIQMKILMNILRSTKLTTLSLGFSKAYFPLVDKVINKLFYS